MEQYLNIRYAGILSSELGCRTRDVAPAQHGGLHMGEDFLSNC